MSKRKPTPAPITQTDLEKFVANESDFGFEMRVLSILRKMEFTCWHSGTYVDPVTQKIREFDLRAEKANDHHRLLLAVECKNIRTNLLVSAVPRTQRESFHNIIKIRPGNVHTFRESQYIGSNRSPYSMGGMVGKRTDQVRRNEDALASDDSTTFDKMNQAINSSRDLVKRGVEDGSPPLIRAVIPVLVVPSNVLWQVDYDAEGRVTKQPHLAHESTLFRDHTWAVTYDAQEVRYGISHLHIVTVDHLESATTFWLGSEGFFRGVS